jgi:hypothetical protein
MKFDEEDNISTVFINNFIKGRMSTSITTTINLFFTSETTTKDMINDKGKGHHLTR